jgi:AraC family ethanolamine operon transcriptional activator
MITRDVHGIEDLEEAVAGAATDPVQLGRGQIKGRLVFSTFDDLVLTRGQYIGDLAISGTFSDDKIAFGTLIASPNALVCGQPIAPGDFGLFPPGFDHFAVYRGATDYLLFKVAPGVLETFAEEAGWHIKADALSELKLSNLPEIWRRYLGRRAREITTRLDAHPEFEAHPEIARDIRRELLRLAIKSLKMLDLLEPSEDHRIDSSLAVINEAESWLRKTKGDAVNVESLCEHLNLSRRQLYRVFDANVGIPPAQFMKNYRLSKARRALSDATSPSVSVTNVATQWGFWDLGHFAKDYRAMFRELPSATLTRAREG